GASATIYDQSSQGAPSVTVQSPSSIGVPAGSGCARVPTSLSTCFSGRVAGPWGPASASSCAPAACAPVEACSPWAVCVPAPTAPGSLASGWVEHALAPSSRAPISAVPAARIVGVLIGLSSSPWAWPVDQARCEGVCDRPPTKRQHRCDKRGYRDRGQNVGGLRESDGHDHHDR